MAFALTSRLRLDELGVEGDPAVRAQLDRVVDALGARERGSLVYPADALARLRHARFDDMRELERDRDAPLRLVVGRRS